MTPQEKAKELVEKMFSLSTINAFPAKQCAIIAVDEILKSQPSYPSEVDWDDCGGTHQFYYEAQRYKSTKYWEQVKIEINNI
jgi:hypothetical protein